MGCEEGRDGALSDGVSLDQIVRLESDGWLVKTAQEVVVVVRWGWAKLMAKMPRNRSLDTCKLFLLRERKLRDGSCSSNRNPSADILTKFQR
ncbi:hypothetical protein Zmor_001678 [Zophobas morio]|uniref:Uncharacterized protein n=1 Tax=Zophobas morio TaxID=2755281 RepID=A0AA38IZH7_9CUCU|nr:hypothetical protein Zmor_001678 [Zophobas morio]